MNDNVIYLDDYRKPLPAKGSDVLRQLFISAVLLTAALAAFAYMKAKS